ncbi:conserved hypothetical protein [Leishmania mexicana MHOM/GT/2001/U1103]|uniref:Uncharacterized protein n=1 Tax=Leishmania mexicana (strain MHOM/GT/2001/U1103) TaxID=929439 RepID=E9AM97_LEIMU|nr:conserved hypothetical protein [Leishmania mexicana MHOM/GT/2001/U1103]CBZ24052.1 conserved hypothetical protein [Leishmania mexicana MHOM/GT/2001/U1103]
MPKSAMSVPGFFPYFGYMLKDVGSRLSMISHYMRTKRHPYPMMRHQNIRAYRGMLPWTQDACFIAPSAFVVGNVVLGHDTVIFYHSVLRNYHTKDATILGDHTVVMDRATLMGQIRVGQGTYIGAGATLDCCEVHDNVYIGPGASIALGAVVENSGIVAAGSAVPKDARVYAGELWAGNPAQKIADVSPAQSSEVQHIVHDQIQVGKAHLKAIRDHIEHTKELDVNWLKEAVAMMEAQQQQMSIKLPMDVPLEARRFLQPRVHMRRPEMHMRMSYPVNRTAPWMPKSGDQTANV